MTRPVSKSYKFLLRFFKYIKNQSDLFFFTLLLSSSFSYEFLISINLNSSLDIFIWHVLFLFRENIFKELYIFFYDYFQLTYTLFLYNAPAFKYFYEILPSKKRISHVFTYEKIWDPKLVTFRRCRCRVRWQ